MTKAIYYHAGCAICVEAERSLLPLLDRKQVDIEVVHLAEDELRVEDDACADDAEAVRIEDSGRDKVQLEDAQIGLDSVPRVGAAIGADHDFRAGREGIGQFAFPLVSPLTSHDDCGGHAASFPLW